MRGGWGPSSILVFLFFILFLVVFLLVLYGFIHSICLLFCVFLRCLPVRAVSHFCSSTFVFLPVLFRLSACLGSSFCPSCLAFLFVLSHLVLLILLLVLFHLSARLSPLSDRPVSSFCLLSLSLSLFLFLFLSFFLWPSPHCGGHPPGPLWPGGVSPGMPQGTDSPCSHKLDCRVTGG